MVYTLDSFALDDNSVDDSQHAKPDSLEHLVVHMVLVVDLDTAANRYFGHLVAQALASTVAEHLELNQYKSHIIIGIEKIR